MKQIDNVTIVVGPARLSYLSVFKPKFNQQKNDGQGVYEYSVTLLFPKEGNEKCPNPKAELKGIYDTVRTVFNEKFPSNPPKIWNDPLKDGDVEKAQSTGEAKYPGYWFMTCAAQENRAPRLIDSAMRPVTGDWESGHWAKAQIRFYAFDKRGNKGVGCGLQGLQFLFKDEKFGGGESPNGFDTEAVAGGDNGETDPFADG